MDEKTILRARDFWTAIVLFFVSLFFLYRTSKIPFFNSASAGVDSAQWYDSAALVPFGVFGILLALSIVLFVISIKDGGAKVALSAVGLDIDISEIKRLFSISIILSAYIFGLVPRVDFIICSALMITALIWGFHRGVRPATYIASAAVIVPALYALIANFPQSEWGKPHDDDWITLISFLALTATMFATEIRAKNVDRVVKATPIVAVLCPLILVLAMAFGFRQNVPNRTGLLFSQIEYNYYVNLRPLWQGKK
ncbi:tripartite tricarboxylate transporter TctB family protein [Ahrensia kielensis]|uniref:tripartite tricarboxylate transporter TctB family protein n=1 Tax=Ahrensia kielensis TaxID=76980 RepID=UPI00037173A6|nr:tripartite tricarboxylate transporter TctB family protein [Ahrensia kielensis]